jgi:hypothetical protein
VIPHLEKPFTKIGLVEWLKVKALSSSLSTAKKKKREKDKALYIYLETAKTIQGPKSISCQQTVLRQLDIHIQNNEVRSQVW